jgi:hypothetical protein
MRSGPLPDSAQTIQRVRVGMTGLASVLVLIGLASAIFSSANREGAVSAIGASNAAVVANLSDGAADNAAARPEQPAVDLAVAPSTGSADGADAGQAARDQGHPRGQ